MTQRQPQDCGIRGAPICGRVEIADHVIFATQSGGAWSVVVNGVVVDQHIDREGALALVSRMAAALRAGSPAAGIREPIEPVRRSAMHGIHRDMTLRPGEPGAAAPAGALS
jgi:hypothetical protein